MAISKYNPIFEITHEEIIATANKNIIAYRDNLSNNLFGLISSNGNIIIPEVIELETIQFWGKQKNVISFLEINGGKAINSVYRIQTVQGKVKLKPIYKSELDTVHRVFKNCIAIYSNNKWESGLRLIDLDGKTLNDTFYLNIIEVVGQDELIGVNYLYVEKSNQISSKSVDILDSYGRIKESKVKWGKDKEEKYLVSIARLYSRSIKSLEYKTKNGRRALISIE